MTQEIEVGTVVTVRDNAYVESFGTIGLVEEINGDTFYVVPEKEADGYWIRRGDLTVYDPSAEQDESDNAVEIDDPVGSEPGSGSDDGEFA